MKVFVNIEASEKELPALAQALLALTPKNGTVAIVATAEDAPAPDVVGDISGGVKTTTPKKAAAKKTVAAPAAAAAPEKTARQMMQEQEDAEKNDLLGGGETAPSAPVPSIADIRKAAEAFANNNSVAKAREVLKRFGAERITDIPEAKRAEFLAAIS